MGGVRHRLKNDFCLCQLGFSLVSRPSARRKVARVNACTIPRSGLASPGHTKVWVASPGICPISYTPSDLPICPYICRVSGEEGCTTAKAQYYTLQESLIRVCGPTEDPQVRLCCAIIQQQSHS